VSLQLVHVEVAFLAVLNEVTALWAASPSTTGRARSVEQEKEAPDTGRCLKQLLKALEGKKPKAQKKYCAMSTTN
jgi:hypothetical protein